MLDIEGQNVDYSYVEYREEMEGFQANVQEEIYHTQTRCTDNQQ